MNKRQNPTLQEVLNRTAGSYVLCKCGATLESKEMIIKHYNMGHFNE